jgi:hypothetical protein
MAAHSLPRPGKPLVLLDDFGSRKPDHITNPQTTRNRHNLPQPSIASGRIDSTDRGQSCLIRCRRPIARIVANLKRNMEIPKPLKPPKRNHAHAKRLIPIPNLPNHRHNLQQPQRAQYPTCPQLMRACSTKLCNRRNMLQPKIYPILKIGTRLCAGRARQFVFEFTPGAPWTAPCHIPPGGQPAQPDCTRASDRAGQTRNHPDAVLGREPHCRGESRHD